MDDMMKIHLLIDNERYPMTIRREDEQLYRDAAKQIDNKLNKYRSYYPDFSPARHWAMAALELAFENISMKVEAVKRHSHVAKSSGRNDAMMRELRTRPSCIPHDGL